MSYKKFPKEELIAALRERGLTLSCAESCTGGWFAKCLVDTPGASAVFRGGVVSYATDVKESLLGVKKKTVKENTVYSVEVAQEMAEGARKLLKTDLAVSVTGVAGPDPQDGIPVGTVCIGIAQEHLSSATEYSFRGARTAIRRAAVLQMFEDLLEEIYNYIETKDK